MVRATLYLATAATIWLAEGFLFSYFLQFHTWQTGLMAVIYLSLLGLAIWLLRRQLGSYDAGTMDLPVWRYLSLAPMAVAVVGSFASLPVLLLIAGLGKIVGA